MELLLSGLSSSSYSVISSSMASTSFSPSICIYRQRINSPRFSSNSTPLSFYNHTGSRSTFLVAGCSTSPVAEANRDSKFGEQSKPEVKGDVTHEMDENQIARLCDKLIDVFMVDKPTPADWRKLIVFSKTWDDYRPHFFRRCQEKAETENDDDKKFMILRFARKLKEVDEDVQRHNELLNAVKNSQSEVADIVARRRKHFTIEFFDHFLTVAHSYYDDPEKQNAVLKLRETCISAVQAYDAATESMEALNAAELKLQDILNSPSVEAGRRKIDSLAEKNQLDSALSLLALKAWSDTKDTSIGEDEAKDILYHLYMKAVNKFQREIPKEIRILKYLLSIKDLDEQMSALHDAFTPGEEIEGDVDMIYTTPEQLHKTIKDLLDSFRTSREASVAKEARVLMNPELMKKMEFLEKKIRDNFM